MDVTFFAATSDCDYSSFEEISESSILGGGFFTKEQISDLLGRFNCTSSAQSDCLWLLPLNFTEAIASIEDEVLKDVAVQWSDEISRENTDVNSMDLAGHLLELKYAYLQHSDKRIFALFE
ncbi:hypothetical protein [Pseudoalteromonas xiamenensis]|uniref:Uncharacterized protein n=1 Tax=Pseudoalteromonas xiamenensis TaxID=882626 RepID=A0A975DHE9_9GAMM|nr:hypothetical protein [Pseudoalteromonas xiamenensis]QTH71614.1 hypothetical protein J5O05_01155 [Pseudoalteromonas xiamenensis]